ncbi:hypothetical protein DRP05_13115 [Archaeoglobales archaeon]|nr:MAG: hypothetical protein DRP05_13115 [Archaeoglobales archaeon]
MFGQIELPYEYATIISLFFFALWITPLVFLMRKSIVIAEYCKKNCVDEVDFILAASHPLARSWWKSLIVWIILTMLWTVV